jgi:hypothetical protein
VSLAFLVVEKRSVLSMKTCASPYKLLNKNTAQHKHTIQQHNQARQQFRKVCYSFILFFIYLSARRRGDMA